MGFIVQFFFHMALTHMLRSVLKFCYFRNAVAEWVHCHMQTVHITDFNTDRGCGQYFPRLKLHVPVIIAKSFQGKLLGTGYLLQGTELRNDRTARGIRIGKSAERGWGIPGFAVGGQRPHAVRTGRLCYHQLSEILRQETIAKAQVE